MKRLLAIVAVVTSAACNDPARTAARSPAPPKTETPPPRAERRDRLPLSQRCTNPKHGFSIAYPAGWHTNAGDVLPPCSVFDPAPIALPAASEIPFDIAVVVTVEDIPFDSGERATSTRWERILSNAPMTLAGRRALRIEAEATGEGLADRGTRSLRYVVDAGEGRTLIATTYDTGPSYEEEKATLARMVETLALP